MMVNTKKCTKCTQAKPLNEFYRLSKSNRHVGDGHYSECKKCARIRDRQRDKQKNIERMRRHNNTEEYKIKHRLKVQEYTSKYPERYKTRREVYKAVQSGKIIRPLFCSNCKKVCVPKAHHEDYAKPFEIIWLCNSCHMNLHNAKHEAFEENQLLAQNS